MILDVSRMFDHIYELPYKWFNTSESDVFQYISIQNMPLPIHVKAELVSRFEVASYSSEFHIHRFELEI